MIERIDRRTTRGLRIREQARESILTAYIDLIRSGNPAPTARETAKRAEFSLRAIFNHFSDLRALRIAAFNRIQTESSDVFFSEGRKCAPLSNRSSAEERVERFVRKHVQRLEYVTPFHRIAAMVESVDREVAKAMKQARKTARQDLEEALGSALDPFSSNEKSELLTALHMVCAWPAWETLRAHYGLSPKRARAVVTGVAIAVLSAAQKRARSGSNLPTTKK